MNLLLLTWLLHLAFGSVVFLTPQEKNAKNWKTRSIYQILTDRYAKTEKSTQKCNDLTDYCGGTFKGIKRKLDHIKSMGFNAIWISPIPENTEKGYHGYWAKDLYKINPYYGTEQDLKDLIKECHEQDIWVMLDVVANHMGNAFDDFSQFNPFNNSADYHKYCLIKNYENQLEVEYCRIGDDKSSLPDLNTEREYVIRELSGWIEWVVREFDFDGIRIDTVKHVRRDFWNGFASASKVFAIGEVLHGDPAYVGPYQRQMDSMLNFPLYFTIRDVFQYKESMWKLEVRWEQNSQYFKDVSVLGNFIDNHDFKRFLHTQRDNVLLRNALTYVIMSQGIPILYQGTEYYFDGGDDPKNRESMWPEIEQYKPSLGHWLFKMHKARELAGGSYYYSKQDHVWTNDDLHVVKRGPLLAVMTNIGSYRSFYRNIKVPEKKRYVNILDPSGKEELEYKGQGDGQWWVELNIKNGEPKIFAPYELIQPVWDVFFP